MTSYFKEIFDSKQLKAAWNLINRSNSFILLGHKDPDRDTVFSCLAMAELLAALGKTDVTIIFPNKPSFKLDKGQAKILFGKHAELPELILSFDAASRERIYFPKEFNNIPLINVDHHLNNSVNGLHNFVDINACSANEVLARLIFAWDKDLLTPSLSQLLLVGILDDSFVFKTQQTGISALWTSLELIKAGADFGKAKAVVANHKTPTTAKLWAGLMVKGQILAHGKLFLMGISFDEAIRENLDLEALDGVINFVANMINCDVVALLRELKPNEIKGSLRAKKTDVQAIAAIFGGGGHKLAAGFTANDEFKNVIKTLEKALS